MALHGLIGAARLLHGARHAPLWARAVACAVVIVGVSAVSWALVDALGLWVGLIASIPVAMVIGGGGAKWLDARFAKAGASPPDAATNGSEGG
ncbi:MAG: hypothetical protein AAF192_08495 [Pseudomonadota bacterium]